MPPVVPKSEYERITTALSTCNFITMDGVQVVKVVKAGDLCTLTCKLEDGNEFSSHFTDNTMFTIADNIVTYTEYVPATAESFTVEVCFYTQSKHFV